MASHELPTWAGKSWRDELFYLSTRSFLMMTKINSNCSPQLSQATNTAQKSNERPVSRDGIEPASSGAATFPMESSIHLQAPNTTFKKVHTNTGLPSRSPALVMAALRGKIASTDLPCNRRATLFAAFERLQGAFTHAKARAKTPVYVMEGATGIASGVGRVSTDPDENMALQAIAFVAHQLDEAAVVAVPDRENQKRTIAFLHPLGVRVAELKAGERLRPGVIYVTRMDDPAAMQETVELTRGGRNVVVLGPPLGRASALLDGQTSVTIMGAAETIELKNPDGTPRIDETTGAPKIGLNPEKLSTNTRDSASAAFVLKAIAMGAAQYASKSMGRSLTVSLAEVRRGTTLLTDADIEQWVENTRRQMLGVAPHPLLSKRMMAAGSECLFEGTPLRLPKGPGIVFAPLFERIKRAKPVDDALAAVVHDLGPGYEFLLQPDAHKKARECLLSLISAHEKEERYRGKGGFDAAREALDGMTDKQAIHAFAAIARAFQNIYEEKTSNGWGNTSTLGAQWQADVFANTYTSLSGRQVPYDAAVVMQPFLGLGETNEEKALIADQLLLILWADFARTRQDIHCE